MLAFDSCHNPFSRREQITNYPSVGLVLQHPFIARESKEKKKCRILIRYKRELS